MRWLLLKDLQILRRSPLQTTLLVVWPLLIAVLVGFAISRSPEKPRVAFLNEVPADAAVTVGATQLPHIGVNDRICERVECVHVKSRAEAEAEVRSGDVLAALILPADLVERINSLPLARLMPLRIWHSRRSGCFPAPGTQSFPNPSWILLPSITSTMSRRAGSRTNMISTRGMG